MSSGGAPRSGETPLSAELATLLSRVASYDVLATEKEQLSAALASAQSTIAKLEARSVQYPFLLDAHAEAQASNKQLTAALQLAEDEVRRAKPTRDALVKELQVRRDARGAWRERGTLALGVVLVLGR